MSSRSPELHAPHFVRMEWKRYGGWSIIRGIMILTRLDTVLAVVLAPLVLVRFTPYRRLVPNSVYRWAFLVGLIFSLYWWAEVFWAMHALRLGNEAVGIDVSVALPPVVLSAEAGMCGFIALPKRWRIAPLVFALPCALLAGVYIVLLVYVRLH